MEQPPACGNLRLELQSMKRDLSRYLITYTVGYFTAKNISDLRLCPALNFAAV